MSEVGAVGSWEAQRWQRSTERAKWLMSLGKLIHEPSRLAILTVLREHGRVRYVDLGECIGLSKSNLSKKLSSLEEAELVAVQKHFEGKKPVTTVGLTEEGEKSVEAYWMCMKNIGDGLEAIEVEKSS